MIDRLHRYQGCLLGLATGDALTTHGALQVPIPPVAIAAPGGKHTDLNYSERTG
jgi:hypothetical protein